MDRNVTITVTTNTNPQVRGRYFVDVRDTTHVANPLHAPQMTTRTRDHGDVVEFIGALTREARSQGVRVTVKDTTDTLKI